MKARISNLQSQVLAPPPTFACSTCHHLRYLPLGDPRFWGLFISYITGGLLTGREVPRPQWLPVIRKCRYAPKLTRTAPRRQEILRRILAGQEITEIAREMEITPGSVKIRLRDLCRQEQVPDRWALAQKLAGGPQPPQAPDSHPRIAQRRQQVQALLLDGLSYEQIADRLSTSTRIVSNDVQRLYRLHAISGRNARANLAQKLGHALPPAPFKPIRQQIATLHASGMRQTQIAATLGISLRKVNYHVIRIKRQAALLPPPPSPTVAHTVHVPVARAPCP